MTLYNLMKEIDYHEQLLKVVLEYKCNDGICRVSQAEIAKRMGKNHTYVVKAIKRLNAEDNCIEMIKNGEYIVHYTNIRERGVFPKILYLFTEKIAYPERYNDEYRLQEKCNLKKKTVQIFTGYLGMTYK